MTATLQFPAIGELVDWKVFWLPGFNKTALIMVLASVLTFAFFLAGSRKRALVPTGVQNLAEFVVEFVHDDIVMQSIGEDGVRFVPYLTAVFAFVFFCNMAEVVPVLQFPATARMALPLFFTAITYVLFNFMGIKRQGLIGYLRSCCGPRGLSPAMYVLVAPIFLLSELVLRPFGLAVRLFANMLAGHLLLVTFAVLTDTLLFHTTIVFLKPIAILPAAIDVILTGFEVLVSVLQAYIFTLLTAVYLGLAMHPEH